MQEGASTNSTEVVTATHYGYSYHGQRMGCANAGSYSSYDPTILAVGPSRYAEIPCGTQVQITGPAGTIITTRQDSCPGCSRNMIDLSEQGSIEVCGGRPHTCRVTMEILR